ncbi:MAG: hypothetical protein R3C02_26640 [Planctomycetaceae bacterium]
MLYAQAYLHEIPTIILDYPHITSDWQPNVRFTTAIYGVHAPGTVYRMDEIPIDLRTLFDSPYKTDEGVLEMLRDRIRNN